MKREDKVKIVVILLKDLFTFEYKSLKNMLNKDDILKYLKENKEIFHQLYGVEKIGLFGSYARNDQTNSSDIDILIDMESGTEHIFDKRLQLRELLTERFSKNVDICHERAIKPFFREIVLKDAIYV